jgi:uncharacterized membrane protein YoaK (UPF0700 family)
VVIPLAVLQNYEVVLPTESVFLGMKLLTIFKNKQQFLVSVLITFSGGFLESYTFITRDGVFANAQTGNIARMGICLASGDIRKTIRYCIPVLSFVLGVTLVIRIRNFFDINKLNTIHWRQLILLLEIMLLLFVAVIPLEKWDVVATVLISFVCAIQVEWFRKIHNAVFASTMCTGNLRSGTEHLNCYFQKGELTHLRKGLFYYSINLTFLFGVIVGYYLTKLILEKAVLFCIVLLLFALLSFFLISGDKEENSG